ncbi:MAG TPA: hypothetical protein VMG12_31060, partial [Polyangiaceae bacterium]|nr:hypothetical protein [Polyangiaceae bacterium]
MRCWFDRTGVTRAFRPFAALGLLALAACSSDDGSSDGTGPGGFTGPGNPDPSGGTMLPPADPAPGVSNYERPPGMPIGQDAPEDDGVEPSAEG